MPNCCWDAVMGAMNAQHHPRERGRPPGVITRKMREQKPEK
jgi:hypothetical protein